MFTPTAIYAKSAVAAEAVPVQDGLRLWLDPNDLASYPGSGSTWYDLTSNHADMQASGSAGVPTWTTPADSGSYFDFPGDNRWFGTSGSYNEYWWSSGSAGTEATIQLWAYWDAWNGSWWMNAIMGFDDQPTNKWILSAGDGTNDLLFHINGTCACTMETNDNAISLGEWYFITLRKNGSGDTWTFYTGTTARGDTGCSCNLLETNSNLTIGTAEPKTAGYNALDGRIGHVFFYDRALSLDEITANYDLTKALYGK